MRIASYTSGCAGNALADLGDIISNRHWKNYRWKRAFTTETQRHGETEKAKKLHRGGAETPEVWKRTRNDANFQWRRLCTELLKEPLTAKDAK
jgi:hypothetical protein